MIEPDRNGQTWCIALEIPKQALTYFDAALSEMCQGVSSFEIEGTDDFKLEGICETRPDPGLLGSFLAIAARSAGIEEPETTVEPLPDIDWVQHVYDRLPPISVGRFYVHGSHVSEPAPPGAFSLLIEAATAFGSGEHETTRGCLIALDALMRRNALPQGRAHILDMGCGSGILGLAAAATLRARVHAVDIDPESARVTRENADINRLKPLVRIAAGDGYHTPLVRQGRPYDLVFANILARPLIHMAPMLRQALKPGGYAILSGLLDWQMNAVVHAHRQQDLKLINNVKVGNWRALLIRKGLKT